MLKARAISVGKYTAVPLNTVVNVVTFNRELGIFTTVAMFKGLDYSTCKLKGCSYLNGGTWKVYEPRKEGECRS